MAEDVPIISVNLVISTTTSARSRSKTTENNTWMKACEVTI